MASDAAAVASNQTEKIYLFANSLFLLNASTLLLKLTPLSSSQVSGEDEVSLIPAGPYCSSAEVSASAEEYVFLHWLKYVVFWKLKQRARIMFTWEDAYYEGNHYRDKDGLNSTACSLNEGPYSHDPLGLVVAKMSYQVYSLGEG